MNKFLYKILTYIDIAEQYDQLLNKIYQEGITQIQDDYSTKLSQKREEMNKIAYQICEEPSLKHLAKNDVLLHYGSSNETILQKIKNEALNGRISSQVLSTFIKQIKDRIITNKLNKSKGHGL